MQNSQMIPSVQESSIMSSDVLLVTTTAMMPTTNQSMNQTMPEDMVFNAGHQLSIIVYRFVKEIKERKNLFSFRWFPRYTSAFLFCLHSILMVISAVGNITVLVLLIKRRMRTPSRLDIMLTHLAIADLMVSQICSVWIFPWKSNTVFQLHKCCQHKYELNFPLKFFVNLFGSVSFAFILASINLSLTMKKKKFHCCFSYLICCKMNWIWKHREKSSRRMCIKSNFISLLSRKKINFSVSWNKKNFQESWRKETNIHFQTHFLIRLEILFLSKNRENEKNLAISIIPSSNVCYSYQAFVLGITQRLLFTDKSGKITCKEFYKVVKVS